MEQSIRTLPKTDKITIMRKFPLYNFYATNRKWLWDSIFFPYFATRFCWIVTAYFVTNNYLPNPTYQKYFTRGFFLTKLFLVDIFIRWDSAGYFSILKTGYQPSSDITTVYSNIPFFPLYPYFVKSIGWLGIRIPDGFYLTFGVILSNILFLAGATLLYQLITDELRFSPQSAHRSLLLIFAFPTSFIFSSFYPESLFFFLAILGFTLAFNNRWEWVAVVSGLILLSRTQGLVVWGALLYLYLERNLPKRVTKPLELGALLLSPIGLILHFAYLYNLTGYPLAPFTAMAAWGRNNSGFLSGILENINRPGLDVFKIDLILGFIFVISSIFILIKWNNKSLGIASLLLSGMPIASGIIVSASRYLLPIFPVFIYWGEQIPNKQVFKIILLISFTLQILFFVGWVNFYWIT